MTGHPSQLAWYVVATAPHVSYALSVDSSGQGWIYFSCQACGDVSQKPCVDPRGRGPHWVAHYAAMHTH